MTLLLFIFATVVSYFLWFFFEESRKKRSLPPGPLVFPVVGSVVSIALAHPKPHLALVKLSEKYGDVMRLRMGPYEYVVLSSMDALNEALLRDESLARPTHGTLMDRMEVPNTGIVLSSGESWKSKRTWMTRAFKDMGIGRTSYFEEATREMVSDLHGKLLKDLPHSGKVIPVDRKMALCTASMMWTLLAGSNTPEDISECEEFLHSLDAVMTGGSLGDGILTIAPFLKHVIPNFTNYTNLMNLVNLGRRLGSKLFHKLLKLEGDSPLNFYHSYILQHKAGRDGFFEADFAVTYTDVMGGAVDTISGYLESLILFLTLYPQKQETLYKEISNFPVYHVFSIADLKKMPCTQAFMLETHRLAIIATNWIPRTLTADINLRGFVLKKGTTFLPNPHAAFKSQQHFGPDPEAFRPERFINPSDLDKLNDLRKLVTPFSIGKRACPGESVAQIVSFLTLVSTVKNFRLCPVPLEPQPTQQFLVGYTAKPQPFSVLISPRSQSNQ